MTLIQLLSLDLITSHSRLLLVLELLEGHSGNEGGSRVRSTMCGHLVVLVDRLNLLRIGRHIGVSTWLWLGTSILTVVIIYTFQMLLAVRAASTHICHVFSWSTIWRK